MKTCHSCQSTFNCEAKSSAACWCMQIPSFLEPNPENDCLCPTCLLQVVSKIITKKIEGKSLEEMLSLAQDSRSSGGFLEYIDYTIEQGNYVFTKWYHLKRGNCCGSGCRNCPYHTS